MSLLIDRNNRQLSYLFLLIQLGLFLFLLSLGPWEQPDSGGYITAGITRSSCYPMILKAYMAGFGTNFYCLVALQIIIGLVAINYVVQLFAEIFELNFYAKAVVYLLFLTPYVGPTLIGNAILTEAICYPFFIFALGELLKGTIYKNYKNLLAGLGWTALLVLTRKQFIFLYPLIAIIITFIFIKYRFYAGKFMVLLAFISSIIAANVVEKSYHYWYHGVFADIPFTGFQLVNGPLFVAKKSDADLFDNPVEKELFNGVFAQMEKKGYLMDRSPDPNAEFYIPYYQKYYAVYTTICYKFITTQLQKLNLSDPYEIDHILVNVALKLIKANFVPYCKLILQNAIQNMGGYYYCFLLIFIFCLTAFVAWKQESAFAVGGTIILLANFGNYALIALVEPVLRRYTMYTEIYTAALIFSLIFIVILNNTKSNKI